MLGSEQPGRRPGVILSRNTVNRASPVVIAVPLTTCRGQLLYPSDILIRAPEAGFPRDTVALALPIRGIDQRRPGHQLGRVGTVTMRETEPAILQVLEIELEP